MARILSQQQRLKIAAAPVFKPVPIPAPYTGWNTRDALDAMEPTDAVTLDNWYPNGGGVQLRNGYQPYANGVSSSAVKTLAEYSAGAINKFLAGAGGGIYDISGGGTAGAPLASGFVSDEWQTVCFLSRTFFFNGQDPAQVFDGSTVGATALTGPTLDALVGGIIYQNRLFAWEKNSTGFWFALLNSISGPMSFFDLAAFSPNGGNLIAAVTFSHDGGNGVLDFVVFLLSSGDALIYYGNDPSLLSNWQLIGIYRLAPIVNPRAVCNYGAEAFATTGDDHLQLQQQLTALKVGSLPPRSKVSNAVQVAVAANGGAFGWQALYYPRGRFLIFNIPNSDGTFDQHIQNTGSPENPWCRFTGMNAQCWGLFQGNLFFGGQAGNVYQADTGSRDLMGAVLGDAQQAWNDFGNPMRKRVSVVRPIVQSVGKTNYAFGVGFDYNQINANLAIAVSDPGSPWDISPWDISPWSPEVQIDANWHIGAGTGQAVGLRLRVAGLKPISWLRTDFRFEQGIGL